MRLLFTLLAILSNSLAGYTQDADQFLLWTKKSSYSYSSVRQSDLDAAGSSYVLGSFYNAGMPYIFFQKFDTNGVLLWSKEYGNQTYGSYPGDVRIDNDENIVISGYLYDVDNQITSNTVNGFFLAKYSPEGEIIWINNIERIRLPTFLWNTQSHMEIDQDNSIVLYSNNCLTGVPDQDIRGLYLSRYNANGELIRHTQITRNDNFDEPTTGGISLDDAGNIIVTGFYHDGIIIGPVTLGTPGPQSPRPVQLFIAKFTHDGNFIWANEIYSEITIGSDVETDLSGNIFLTGSFGGLALYNRSGADINSTDHSNGFLAKISASGSLQWVKTFSRVQRDFPEYNFTSPTSIKRTAHGNLYISGYCYGGISFDDFTLKRKDQQSFVMKLSADAEFEGVIVSNAHKYEGRYVRIGVNSTIDAQGNIYTIGNFASDIVFGCDTLDSTNDNLFITKYSEFPPVYDLKIQGPSEICKGSVLNLSGSNIPEPVKYFWSLPPGVIKIDQHEASNELTTSVEYSANNSYISLSIRKGCYQYDALNSYKIKINEPPASTSINGSQLICESGTFRYFANSIPTASLYEWSIPSGGQSNSSITSNPYIDISFSEAFTTGDLMVKVKNSCGTSPLSLPLQIKRERVPAPVSILGDSEYCNDEQQISFTLTESPEAINYTWHIPSLFVETGVQVTSGRTIALTLKSSGQAALTAFASNTCHQGEKSEIQITVNERLSNPVLTKNDCETVLHTEPGINIQWHKNGFIIAEGVESLAITEQGSYWVTNSNFCGVASSSTLQVTPVFESNFFIPNIITPNGDDKNEVLNLGPNIKGFNVNIIGRWGTVLYNNPDYQNDWDGGDLPTGTYFFRISHKCLDKYYEGWVQIAR